MVFGSLDLGSVVGLLVCGPIIRRFGWPSVFYLFAVIGLVWAALWPLCRPDEADTTQPAPPPPAASRTYLPTLIALAARDLGCTASRASAHAALRLLKHPV